MIVTEEELREYIKAILIYKALDKNGVNKWNGYYDALADNGAEWDDEYGYTFNKKINEVIENVRMERLEIQL